MIAATDLVRHLVDAGLGLYSGVPCSYLTPLINQVIDSPEARYVNAVNEGDGVAIVAGAWLGGRMGAVMFQNSGFGNAVNPLTSLAYTFRIPMLVLCTWRGEPGGEPDEPQHELMGRITPRLFDTLEIPFEQMADSLPAFAQQFQRVSQRLADTSLPVGLLLRQGIIEGAKQPKNRPDLNADRQLAELPPPRMRSDRFEQDAAVGAIRDAAGDSAVLLATTGFTGRALYALGDRDNQFYMAGSMGCAVSLGLGLATVRPERRIVVLDGDGAILMRLGALATVGLEAPANLTHIVLDNAAHDSTGTQATVSPAVDLPAVAAACGYRNVRRIQTLDQIGAALKDRAPGPTFLHVRTLPRENRKLPRPRISPPDVARRLQRWLGEPLCENASA